MMAVGERLPMADMPTHFLLPLAKNKMKQTKNPKILKQRDTELLVPNRRF